MVEQFEKMMKELLQSEFYSLYADIIFKLVTELESRGFSHEEAITIASNMKMAG